MAVVQDPIADFLVRLQNASMVGKERVSLPYSKIKHALADVLVREGYLVDAAGRSKDGEKRKTLVVTLSYKDGRPAITKAERVSKSSRRVYMGVRELRPIKNGYGLLVLSTPEGLLTGKEARLKRVGGEALCKIW